MLQGKLDPVPERTAQMMDLPVMACVRATRDSNHCDSLIDLLSDSHFQISQRIKNRRILFSFNNNFVLFELCFNSFSHFHRKIKRIWIV